MGHGAFAEATPSPYTLSLPTLPRRRGPCRVRAGMRTSSLMTHGPGFVPTASVAQKRLLTFKLLFLHVCWTHTDAVHAIKQPAKVFGPLRSGAVAEVVECACQPAVVGDGRARRACHLLARRLKHLKYAQVVSGRIVVPGCGAAVYVGGGSSVHLDPALVIDCTYAQVLSGRSGNLRHPPDEQRRGCCRAPHRGAAETIRRRTPRCVRLAVSASSLPFARSLRSCLQ